MGTPSICLLALRLYPPRFMSAPSSFAPVIANVDCHASATDVDGNQDLRIKMCIHIDADNFTTIHHEEGHNEYQRAYRNLPFLFRDGANDGFHEAIGDSIALSITPEYLMQLHLIDTIPPPEADIPLQLRTALDKVAFLPFGLLIDKWRWQVFSGKVHIRQVYMVIGGLSSVLQSDVRSGRLHRPAEPVQLLRLEGCWREAGHHAQDRRLPTLATDAQGNDWRRSSRCDSGARILPASIQLAETAKRSEWKQAGLAIDRVAVDWTRRCPNHRTRLRPGSRRRPSTSRPAAPWGRVNPIPPREIPTTWPSNSSAIRRSSIWIIRRSAR